MEITLDKSESKPSKLNPSLGDIFVSKSGICYILAVMEGSYCYCRVEGDSWAISPTTSTSKAFYNLKCVTDCEIKVGENYFPADQIALSIKPIGGAWHGTF